MAILISLGALGLAGFVFYIQNRQREDFNNRIDQIEKDVRAKHNQIDAKLRFNFGKKK